MIDGARLTRALTLEERDIAPDGSGGAITTWRTLGTLWADVTARGGRESFVAGRPASRVDWQIVVRGAPVGAASRPRPDQRFRDGERVFNILSVAEADPRGRYLRISAEEGVLP